MLDYIIGLGAAVIVAYTIYRMIRKGKNKSSGCDGCCSSCGKRR